MSIRRLPSRLALVACLALAATCGKSSPATPSGSGGSSTPAATRIISIVGTGNFGSTTIGSSGPAGFSIENSGNSTLTITAISVPASFTIDKTSGSIAPAGFMLVTVTFKPTTTGSFGGPMTITSDATSGTSSLTLSATGAAPAPTGPQTSFGNGKFVIGTNITAGRYFSSPPNGCYWERESGLGGTLGEIISNDFIAFNAGQWIVDVAAADKGFQSSGCGTWNMTARSAPASGKITPGMWMVGSQIASGTYQANSSAGCYWERLRSFGGQLGEIFANDFISGAGLQTVTISSGDTGFDSDGDCGTWSKVSSETGQSTAPGDAQSLSDIARNRDLARARGAVDRHR